MGVLQRARNFSRHLYKYGAGLSDKASGRDPEQVIKTLKLTTWRSARDLLPHGEYCRRYERLGRVKLHVPWAQQVLERCRPSRANL